MKMSSMYEHSHKLNGHITTNNEVILGSPCSDHIDDNSREPTTYRTVVGNFERVYSTQTKEYGRKSPHNGVEGKRFVVVII